MNHSEFEVHGPLSEDPSTLKAEGGLSSKLVEMLDQSNGFHLHGGALLFLPSGSGVNGLSTIEEFNAAPWKTSYGPEISRALFFAVDAIGYPFGILDERIIQFDPETGELTEIATDFDAFFSASEADPNGIAGAWLYGAWLDAGRQINANERLAPNHPLIFVKTSGIDDFHAENMLNRTAFNAYLYEQTKDLPDGAKVKFVVTP